MINSIIVVLEQYGSIMHAANLAHAIQHMKELRLALDGTRHDLGRDVRKTFDSEDNKTRPRNEARLVPTLNAATTTTSPQTSTTIVTSLTLSNL